MAGAESVVSDVEAVMDFLRKNGLRQAESALKEDIIEKSELGSFDFEKFLFELPPVRIAASVGLRGSETEGRGRSRSNSVSTSSDNEEFVSLASSTSGVCSSDFINPYGLRSASNADSESSSERLSQFGTARDYPDHDMQNDLYWYDEKDEGYFMTPCFNDLEYYGSPSEDKFIMMLETGDQHERLMDLSEKSEGFETDRSNDYLGKPCPLSISMCDKSEFQAKHFVFDKRNNPKEGILGKGCSVSPCKCCAGADRISGKDPVANIYVSSKEADFSDFQSKCGHFPSFRDIGPVHREEKNSDYSSTNVFGSNWTEGIKNVSDIVPNRSDDYEVGDGGEVNGGELELQNAADGEAVHVDELLMYTIQEDDYEILDDVAILTIDDIHRTGFEETKDLPIVLNTVIASRYYVTEYLGSAAFSKVVQAHDLHTGIDVCLKIIKNDKDFFDQSLDEIKLLKLVNKYDPADEHHILRLYDYFYHQEHLFIVCELLKANLYEFQKFNQDTGGEAYFTLRRLQLITRQCLEALEYLHRLGIIHCDLKPENILIKSYRRSEIKVIDLGSSCFQSDNLCLYVQSRSYRAPEVILGLPYDQKIDLWSLGCILAELCSGEVLFPNDVVVMILAKMIGMLGPIDLEMLERGQEIHKYFTKEYDLYHLNEETNQLEYIIPEESSLQHHLQIYDDGFIDFVRNLLEINPLRRPTATEALEHPWLSHSYGSS